MAIEQAVDSVSERFGINDTGNPATTEESGSSVVAMALEGSGHDMSEANVAAICSKRRQRELVHGRRQRNPSRTGYEVLSSGMGVGTGIVVDRRRSLLSQSPKRLWQREGARRSKRGD